jgi:hypothetical protein
VTAIRRLKTDFDESFCYAKTKAPTEARANKEREAVEPEGKQTQFGPENHTLRATAFKWPFCGYVRQRTKLAPFASAIRVGA